MDFFNQLTSLMQQIELSVLYQLFSIFVGLDVLTGIIKSFKLGKMKSRTLRDGLFASVAEMFILIIAVLVTKFIPATTLPVFIVMLFMCIKELYSILENLTEIGARLPKFLIKGLDVYINKIDNLEIKNNEEVKKND
ncbi:phage holin family protein [uncultured Clostridium sp.]|uniref:phage holin family protein n=1 Tax=uncultured Clostridium sp. TaxID=59620 RepID=UPI002605B813|nr:phage holin family protein [uncultured Clostridium sp.]